MSEPDPIRRSRRKGSGAVTLREVAQLAGVAPITASRAMNTPEQVSEDVRARVAEAVKQTGYVPNLLAGALSSMRSRMVGLSVPTIAGPVFLDTVQGLTETLFNAGYQVMLGQTGYDNAREDAWLAAMLGRRPDAVVLTGTQHSEHTRTRLQASGIPVVETWDQTDSPIDMLVGFSHVAVGQAVARYLAQRGYRQLGAVAGADERAQRRYQAFRDEARALGLPEVPLATVPTPTTLGGGRRGLAELLAREVQPQAVFCSSDSLALGVLTEAQARGLEIPRQLAIVGFGDLAFAADLHPALTTVRIDGQAIGRQAAEFIIQRLQGPLEASAVDVGFTLVERQST